MGDVHKNLSTDLSFVWSKKKKHALLKKYSKVRPTTSHEGPEGEEGHSSTLSLTSALDGDGW
jgi:hypothetical protein